MIVSRDGVLKTSLVNWAKLGQLSPETLINSVKMILPGPWECRFCRQNSHPTKTRSSWARGQQLVAQGKRRGSGSWPTNLALALFQFYNPQTVPKVISTLLRLVPNASQLEAGQPLKHSHQILQRPCVVPDFLCYTPKTPECHGTRQEGSSCRARKVGTHGAAGMRSPDSNASKPLTGSVQCKNCGPKATWNVTWNCMIRFNSS